MGRFVDLVQKGTVFAREFFYVLIKLVEKIDYWPHHLDHVLECFLPNRTVLIDIGFGGIPRETRSIRAVERNNSSKARKLIVITGDIRPALFVFDHSPSGNAAAIVFQNNSTVANHIPPSLAR